MTVIALSLALSATAARAEEPLVPPADAPAAPPAKGVLHVEASQDIAARPAQIWPYVSKLQTWDHWTAWGNAKYPKCVETYSGEPGTVGHSMSWTGSDCGKGHLTITALDPEKRASFDLYFGNSKKGYPCAIAIEGMGDTAKVTWSSDMKLGFPLSLFKGKMRSMLVSDYTTGLAGLKGKAEPDFVAAKKAEEEAAAKKAAEEEAAKKAAEEAAKKAEEEAAAKKAAEDEAAKKASEDEAAKKGKKKK